MNGLGGLVRPVRAAKAVDSIPALWRGRVQEVLSDGMVWVHIPRLSGDSAVGPMPTSVAGLLPNEPVLVAAMEDSRNDLLVVSRLTEGKVVLPGHFSFVVVDDAPTAPEHATRKDYVDAQVATRALANHTHTWASITSKPTTFAPIIGTTATTAKAGNYVPTYAEVTGKPATFPPTIGTTATTAKAGNYVPSYAELTGTPSTFPPGAHTHAAADVTTGSFDWARMPNAVKLPTTAHDLNDYVTFGLWHQDANTGATASTNYPLNNAGLLEVFVNVTNTFVYQRYSAYTSSASALAKVFTRGRYNSVWGPWAQQADQTIATASLNGLMSATDKAKLDAATASNTDGTLVLRYNGGETNLKGVYLSAAPTSASHATRKDYVDAMVWDGSRITTGTISDARIANATAALDGLLNKADKAKLDAASAASTANTLVMLDSAGRAKVSNPSATTDIANKQYVDAGDAARALLVHRHTYADIDGLVPTSALPPLAVNDVFTVADQAGMLALTAQRGDMAIRTDNGKSYALSADTPTVLAAWKELMATGQVVSVNGKTGVVAITKADVGLGSVDNTTDAAKPISTATQTALNGKANTAHVHSGADITTGTISDARIANATAALDGLMPKADKSKLDAATAAATASTLVMLDSAGRAKVANPSAVTDIANKQYVDAATDAVIRGADGKKYRIIACTVRNTGSGFELINDAAHVPIGVSSVTTAADSFTLNYSFTAKTVGSVVATGDEKMTESGFIFGASVGLSSSVFYASQPGGAADYVTYNGSAWTSFNGFVTGITMNGTTGLVTCTHQAVAPAVGGSITSRSLTRHGVLDAMGATSTAFYFVDSAGTPDKTPRTEHRMWVHRAGARNVPMSELTTFNSNIWIYGVMEVA